MTNPTIETILKHRSIRKFTDQPLTEEQIELLVKSAQAASTSSFTQSYSIIGIDDANIKKQLRAIASDQKYVEENGYFFVFVADQYRNKSIGEKYEADISALDTIQRLFVAYGDASFAAQNLALAAESLGLGICYIGSILNDVYKTAEILQLPDYTFPLFGIAVGYPNHSPEQKPRLPQNVIFHRNHYDKEQLKPSLDEYDKVIGRYYESRTGGTKEDETWTKQIARGLSGPLRKALKPYLEEHHLGLR